MHFNALFDDILIRNHHLFVATVHRTLLCDLVSYLGKACVVSIKLG